MPSLLTDTIINVNDSVTSSNAYITSIFSSINDSITQPDSLFQNILTPTYNTEAVFGSQSILHKTVAFNIAKIADHVPLYDSIWFKSLTILFFFLYIYIIHTYKDYINFIFKTASLKSGLNKLYENQSIISKQFMSVISLSNMILWVIFVVKIMEFFRISFGILNILMLGLLCTAFILIKLYHTFCISILARISLNESFFSLLNYHNKVISTLSNIIIAPTLILSAINTDDISIWFMLLATMGLVVTTLWILWKSLIFFVVRKVSILQWISYICIVELFPVSIFITVGYKLIHNNLIG